MEADRGSAAAHGAAPLRRLEAGGKCLRVGRRWKEERDMLGSAWEQHLDFVQEEITMFRPQLQWSVILFSTFITEGR
jgi:hypothetical protein